VRLGEYDQSKDPDCRSYDSKEKCLPSIEDIDVEKVFMHEDYKKTIGSSDIALVQLSRKVEFEGELIITFFI